MTPLRPILAVTAPALLISAALAQSTAPAPKASGKLDFSSPVSANDLAAALAARPPSPDRAFLTIRDGFATVGFPKGEKVTKTGLSLHAPLPPTPTATLQFRVRFPADFEQGLHGKQMGLSGGKGYDGGRGKQARENGDGWSIRLQFDSRADAVTNQLYVYHSQMGGTYGDHLGTGTAGMRYSLERGKWHTVKLRVTMQTSAEVADGRIEVWSDGVKRFDVHKVRFVTKDEGRTIDRLRLEVFPGGGGVFPSRDTGIDFDDITWSVIDQPDLPPR